MARYYSDKYNPAYLAQSLNKHQAAGMKTKFWKCMELIERTSEAFFADLEAFASLSLENVVLLTTLNTHYTYEVNLIRCVVKWCVVNCAAYGNDCRGLLHELGMMEKLRWGTMDTAELTFTFAFLFSASEISDLLKRSTDATVELPFINMSNSNRGMDNVITNDNILLCTAPFNYSQTFQNTSETLEVVQLIKIQISPRIFKYTGEKPWRLETVDVIFTFGDKGFLPATMTSKYGSTTMFHMEYPVVMVLSPGDTVSIDLRFKRPGLFRLDEQPDCFGFHLDACGKGIITQLHSSKGTWL